MKETYSLSVVVAEGLNQGVGGAVVPPPSRGRACLPHLAPGPAGDPGVLGL